MRRFAVVVVAVAALLVLVELVIRSISLERQRPLLEARISDAIGLECSLGSDLHLELLTGLHLEATGVTVASPPGRSEPYLLEIGRLSLDLRLWKLLRGIVEIDELHLEDTNLTLQPDPEGSFGLSTDVEALTEEPPQRNVALRVHEVGFEQLRVFYQHPGRDELMTAHVERLWAGADSPQDPLQVEVQGELDGGPFELEAELGSLDELLEPTHPYPVWLEAKLFEVELEVGGTVARPMELEGVELAILARVSDDLAALSAALDRDLPSIGPIAFSTRLTNAKGPLALEELRLATLDAEPLQVELTGAVAELQTLRGIEFKLELHAESSEFLQRLAQREIGALALDAELEVSDGDGSLGIEGEVHAEGGDDSLSVDLVGGQDDLSGIQEVDVRAALRSRDIGALARALGFKRPLPPIGPVVVRGRFRDHEGALAIDDLDVRIGSRDDAWIELTGSIRDLIRMSGVELEATFGAVDLRHARALLQRELPALGPVEGNVRASDRDGTLGIERFELSGGREEMVRIAVSGGFDDIRETDEITVQARLTSPNLVLVGELLDADLPDVGPVEFEGRVTGSNERLASEGRARLDKTVVRGRSTVSFGTGDRTRVWTRLSSPHVHLDDIGIEPRREPLERVRRRREEARADGADRPRPLPFEELRQLDLDAELRAERVTGREGLELEDVVLALKLEDGELLFHELDSGWKGGRLDAQLRIDSRTPDPELMLAAEVNGIDLGRLAAQLAEQPGGAGIIDATVSLRTEGHTTAELRSNLQGNAWLVLRDGATTGHYVNQFMVTLVRVSMPSLRVGRVVSVGCTVGDFEVEDGVANVETLVLRSPRATVSGEGSVDLARGEYDLRLTPSVRDPGLVSIAASVDVTGPLANPRFRPVKRSLATSAAQAVVSNVMRPGRLMARTVRRGGGRESDEELCAGALAERPEHRPLTRR